MSASASTITVTDEVRSMFGGRDRPAGPHDDVRVGDLAHGQLHASDRRDGELAVRQPTNEESNSFPSSSPLWVMILKPTRLQERPPD